MFSNHPVEFLDAQQVVLPEDVDVGEGAEEEQEQERAEKRGEHSHYFCLWIGDFCWGRKTKWSAKHIYSATTWATHQVISLVWN